MATGHIPLELQPLELTTIATAAIDAISSAAKDKGVHVTARFDGSRAFVAGDAHRLEQIVGNLLSNAVKFTPAGGSVEVTVHGGGSVAELTVRDSGQGISPDFMPHVFERFRQGDGTTTREHSGLGLGLAIAQNLAELHGGRIEAMSGGEGKGATFTLSLPLLDVSRVAAAEATPVNS
jgi:signal transduction histidine kinase